MAIEWKGSSLARKVFLRLFLLVMFLTAFGGAALAQSSAALGGTVTDATGAVVPNAQVMVTNQATGVASATQTDTTGAYLFPALPIGIYRIEVSASSFQTAVISNLKLDVATALTRNIQLTVGPATDKVVILAEAALVDTTTTS